MFKAIKDGKIVAINEVDYFPCLVRDSVEQDTEHTVYDYEQVEGQFILKGEIPAEIQNERIRAERQARYEAESDPIRLDYDEALAKGQATAETLKQEWLASKDKIREELPYVE